MDDKDIGAEIRRLRKEARLTQEELSHQAQIANVTLQRIESGETSTTVRTLIAIAGALGREPASLLKDPKRDERLLPTSGLASIAAFLAILAEVSPPRLDLIYALAFDDESFLAGNPSLLQSYRALDLTPEKQS